MQDVDWTQLRETSLANFTLDALPPTLKLPALPLAVTRFVEKSRDDSASAKDLAAIVETDAGLTLELLKHVNSAFVGLRQRAKTVQQAIALLGLRQTKLMVISAGTQAAVQSRRSKLINQNCFWNACLQKAIFAREVAKLLKTDAEVAFAGALLQDYLLPVLTNDLFDHYVEFTEHRSDHAECLTDYERSKFGWDHAMAGASLACRWKLPDELCCCILMQHRGLTVLADPQLARTPVAAVALSALLPDQLRQHYSGLEQLALLQTKWPAFNLVQFIDIVDREHPCQGLGVDNNFPLSRRCKPLLERMSDQRSAV
jgi:HD-like signal output (HDOD) protein